MKKTRQVLVCLIIFVVILSSCKKNTHGVLSFEDTVEFMENDPRQFLAKLDTTSLKGDWHDEDDATVFLLKSMCQNYINENEFPPQDKIEKCVSVISASKDISKQLESLMFLAKIYQNNNDTENEIMTINHALDIAKDEKNNKWIFFLYTYLSEIRLKNIDLIRYAEFQNKAKSFYNGQDLKKADIYTKLTIGKIFIYNHEYDKAVDIFKCISQAIGEKHAYYGHCHFLLGVAYFKKGDWTSCIAHTEKALQWVRKPRNLFICYSILTHCYASVENVEKTNYYKNKAMDIYSSDESVAIDIEFYKTCAELAVKSGNVAEENFFLRKTVEVYEKRLALLKVNTLNETLLKSDYSQKESEYKKEIVLFKFMVALLVIALLVLVMLYIRKKQKHTVRISHLNEHIDKLEALGHIDDETRYFIARDIEIAKRVSYLKYSGNNKNKKLYDEIEKLKILDGNKLLDAKWNDFFTHIDIIYDEFYTRLLQNYPVLTDKDIQLCCMLVAGFRTEEIAAVWGQSIYTVHKNKTNVRKKISSPEGVDLITFLKEKLYLCLFFIPDLFIHIL